ncbi:alpha/beta hydrolase [Rhodococcus pyridinivorans]|uniref:alpha/beta hydrolase family protein n=1 Tax=Rhodococcus pyridinivorans TaxID=103816 RepID=UPI001E489CFB|nr:alpha/beta hydrolase [Rhodococcus pyridinivorans]MCD5422464.1 alpha/beta hydrolase [Rhodococcus pyridinivorans]
MIINDGAVRRRALILNTEDASKVVETYGFAGSQGVNLEGQLLRTDAESTTLFVFIHPTSTLNLMPLPAAMAARGLHVLCAASRYPKNDAALILEKVVLDLGAWVRWAREEEGYEKVVLVGWSGGGSLSLLYQAEAEDPTITHTPAGDPVDVVGAGIPQADGVIFIAAHLSRAETLTEWIDPSVIDEADPYRRDPVLDIYAVDPRHRPPYDAEFIARFRDEQRARNRRITEWVRSELALLEASDGPELERPFIVHRTMCDVRWLDPTIDPNDRQPDWCYLGDPRVVNAGPVGLARFTTLRSWLSQWSLDDSRARSGLNAPRVKSVPVLQIENSADDAVPGTHSALVRAALGTDDKKYELIEGATHYYKGQPEHLARCIDIAEKWSRERGLL